MDMQAAIFGDGFMHQPEQAKKELLAEWKLHVLSRKENAK